ncbi:unnamed protein product [Rhizoctonia solani]|uniref:F-box domain-containing protein n=1 Tax=Rhizoctonia solani TaxID=456999 RepID=A0A8H3DZR1_9AGAM|nr:unnamed protein product [Rhizoctonia solani]
MPTTKALTQLKEYNRLQCINHLPLELLSHIFLLCDEDTSYDKETPSKYIQVVAPAVCCHWRKVALGTTALWTTIRIMNPAPCKRTALYLAHSGSGASLDIKILIISPEIRKGDKLRELHTYAQQALITFNFIISNGGSPSRWKRLSFGTNIFACCSVAIDFLSKADLSSLENLDFVGMGPWPDHPEDGKMFMDSYNGETTPKPLFLESPPQLRSIRLEGVLDSCLFGDISRPHLAGLTNIYIAFAGPRYPRIDHIYTMLAASPCLIELCFNTGDLDPLEDGDSVATTSTRTKIILPNLESLIFMHITNPIWNLAILQLFKAPALHTLELSFWHDPDTSQQLVDFISDQLNQSSPYFPVTLSTLSFFTMMGETPDLEPLLRAYPNLSTLRTGSIASLLKRPWLAPNLTSVDLVTQDASELKELIIGRCGDGLPLNEVEVRFQGNEDALSGDDREQIERMVKFRFCSWQPHVLTNDEEEGSDSENNAE